MRALKESTYYKTFRPAGLFHDCRVNTGSGISGGADKPRSDKPASYFDAATPNTRQRSHSLNLYVYLLHLANTPPA